MLTTTNLSCLPAPLWCIVCSYTCEDPKIVDVITNTKWGDYSRCGASLLRLLPYHDHIVIFLLELRVPTDEGYFYRYSGHKLYERLLMLPVMKDDESEVACRSPSVHIVTLRDKLYQMLDK